MEFSWHLIVFVASFAMIALAAKQIGNYFSVAQLPLISGFLLTGILAGPYVLGLLSGEVTSHLRFVDEMSLAVIAFAAGSELYLQELRSRLRSIAWITLGNTIVVPLLGGGALLLLANMIPFMRPLSTGGRLAVALLAGAILVARSPSSAIAIVDELRAKGPFTQTVLGVTMVTDVVVIALFAVSSSVADALLTSLPFDLGFVLLLLLEFVLELALGLVLARFLVLILANVMQPVIKAGAILITGYGIFALAGLIRGLTHRYWGVEIFLEPLLVCMVGSFFVTNHSNYRADFLKLLHDIGPGVYIAFFTLTGAELSLNVLATAWPVALTLFLVRGVAIGVGTYSGGELAGDPPLHNRVGWMTYITQAGVGLGSAKEVAVEFATWGAAFATVIIAVIVLSQLAGPPLFKWAITRVGEARTRAPTPPPDAVHHAIIFGLEGQSLALARLLSAHGWIVKLGSRRVKEREDLSYSGVDIHPIEDLTVGALRANWGSTRRRDHSHAFQ